MKRLFLTIIILSLAIFILCADDLNVCVAWREEIDNPLFETLLEAGVFPTFLDQIKAETLSDEKTTNGGLTHLDAKKLKEISLSDTNINAVIGEEKVDLIIIPGGRDISPSLYNEEENGSKNESKDEDISDYILIKYALENNIPLLGICRGMQMIAVYYGESLIQDLPSFFTEENIEYDNLHLSVNKTKEEPYSKHSIYITNKDSILYSLFNEPIVEGLPSVHHQAIKTLENTPLEVTAYTETDGLLIIEAFEDVTNPCVLGIQFHPEKIIPLEFDGADANKYMAKEKAIGFFSSLFTSFAAYTR